MACSHPIPVLVNGYKINKDGKRVRNLKFIDIRHRYFGFGLDELKEKFGKQLLLLPCGRCYLCSLDYARSWSSRIMLEAKYHLENCFITLTYDEAHVPLKLEKRPLQLFMKRLRKVAGVPIRFFACGEVGEGKGSRGYNPHYHVIIFGYDFSDKVFLKRSHSGLIIYRSPLLEKLWPFGLSSIGDVSPESAQYCAKYSIKRKISGNDLGEFVLMSRKPGIGAASYSEDIYETDKIYVSGKQFKVPRYFDKLADASGSVDYLFAKEYRIRKAQKFRSKKYQFNLAREEFALDKMQEDKIRQDVLKVRNI